jgi:hypothetical protein
MMDDQPPPRTAEVAVARELYPAEVTSYFPIETSTDRQ